MIHDNGDRRITSTYIALLKGKNRIVNYHEIQPFDLSLMLVSSGIPLVRTSNTMAREISQFFRKGISERDPPVILSERVR